MKYQGSKARIVDEILPIMLYMFFKQIKEFIIKTYSSNIYYCKYMPEMQK